MSTRVAVDDLKLCYDMLITHSLYPKVCPGFFDSIFVWGRAKGEWEARDNTGVLQHAAALHLLTGAPIYIPGYRGRECGQGVTGYPGPEVWADFLENSGVSTCAIRKTEGKGCNTKTEFEDFLQMAEQFGHERTIGVTTLLHAPRAILGAVASMDARKMENHLLVLSWPEFPALTTQVWGSQGEGPYPLRHWVSKEFERIPKYTEQGDLASFARLQEYLNNCEELISERADNELAFYKPIIACYRQSECSDAC